MPARTVKTAIDTGFQKGSNFSDFIIFPAGRGRQVAACSNRPRRHVVLLDFDFI